MFAHRLVEAGIGGRTVGELNNTMTVDEFLRWETYDQINPIGYTDLQFGWLRQLLASIYSRKGSPDLKRFLLGDWPEDTPDLADLETKLDKLEAATGGQPDEN